MMMMIMIMMKKMLNFRRIETKQNNWRTKTHKVGKNRKNVFKNVLRSCAV